MTSSYYDIDAILAEEELVPCTTLFDFSHLAHLDPDARHHETHLPEASRIKMPLWAMEKWAMLGFVRLSLPRHYGRKARERLEADPGDADLRYENTMNDVSPIVPTYVSKRFPFLIFD
jgi:GINS complex subunit 3